MQNLLKILLFDVDGVIIDPRAYIIGINKTIEFLCEQIGLHNSAGLLPAADDIAYMEAHGTHDAWDITNIMFASIIINIAMYFKKQGEMPKMDDMTLSKKLETIKRHCPKVKKPDYKKVAKQVADNASFSHPPDVALRQLSTYIKDEMPEADQEAWISLLKDFLVGTRQVHSSYGTRIFQNIILGTNEFESTYGLASQWDGPALLESEDKVIINSSSVKKINKLTDDFKLAIYTARPSFPPDTVSHQGYSPEAEMAMRLAGLTNIPLVGLGMMQWLAEQHNRRVEDLVKPNITQAIAALLAAITKTNDEQILEQAYGLEIGTVHPDQTYFKHFKKDNIVVYVFEDIISGVKAMLDAGKKLQEFNYMIHIKPLGIAGEENKAAALKQYCRRVFPDVNQALDFTLSDS